MDTILKWASQYSEPIIFLLICGAALIFVLKLVVEKAIAREFNRREKRLEVLFQRRSEFEQQVLLDRYKLVCELSQELERIATDLNRHFSGLKVEGLFDGIEVVPLTEVCLYLETKKFLLPQQFYDLFDRQASIVGKVAEAKTSEQRKQFTPEYLANREQLVGLINEEFGIDKISWKTMS